MDILNTAVSLMTDRVAQKVEIAAIKAQQNVDKMLVDMITEVVEDSRVVNVSTIKGSHVDTNI